MSQTLSDEEFIKNPDVWPNWPLLTVQNLESNEVGTLFCGKGMIPHEARKVTNEDGQVEDWEKNEKVVVILENAIAIMLKEVDWKTAERKTYNSVKEFLKEWRID